MPHVRDVVHYVQARGGSHRRHTRVGAYLRLFVPRACSRTLEGSRQGDTDHGSIHRVHPAGNAMDGQHPEENTLNNEP